MTLADGCFDPLHVGHVRYLREAAQLDRPLFVTIADDDAIRAKGRTPFQSRDERAEVIFALDMVDGVRVLALPEAIRALRPKYLAKGLDWMGKLPADVLEACHETGTEIVWTDTLGRSSAERLRA